MYKRLRLWRLRSRFHLRSAVLVVLCLASSIIVFDSVMTERQGGQGHFPHIKESQYLITNTTRPQALRDPLKDASRSGKLGGINNVLMQTRNENEYDNFDGYESKFVSNKPEEKTIYSDTPLILSENVQKYSGKNKESSRVTNIKLSNKDPSFGFVNKDFKPPPPRQRRGERAMDILQGIMQVKTLVGPGSLLGAVAALKQFQTSQQSQNRGREKQQNSNAQQSRPTGAPDTHHNVLGSHEQDQESDTWKGTKIDFRKSRPDNTPGKVKDSSVSHVQTSNFSNSGRRGVKGRLRIMSSPPGHNGSPGDSILGSFMNVFASTLLSALHTKNDRQMEGAVGGSKTSPLHTLMGGLAPLLGSLGGLGGSRRGPDSPVDSGNVMHSLHSIMSQVGSSIMAESALHPNSPIPLQSLIANLGPVLLSAFTQGYDQNTNNKRVASPSPMQAILTGLLPAVMTNVLQQGPGAHNRGNPSPQNSIPGIVNGMEEKNMKAKQIGVGGFLAEMAPMLMIGAGRRGSRKLQETKGEGEAEDDYYSVASSGGHESPGGGMVGVVKLLARTAMSSLLPEEIKVPEMNSTRSLWDMAVNLAFGNPRDDHGRNSKFWQWVSEYIGDEAPLSNRNTEESTPAWITAALRTHVVQRDTNAQTLAKLYQRLEDPQPLCHHLRSVGGSFIWRTGVLSNARDVCMDADVAPRTKGCIVYSFGIRNKWNFEEDMEDMGCEVWAFDPAMTTGNHNHSSHIHFYNLGLTPSTASTIITEEEQRWQAFPLAEVMERLGHDTSTIDYLKLDIGGSEWQVLHETAKYNRHALTNLKQLGVEVHLEAALREPTLYSLYLDTLEALESLGFQLFSSRVTQRRGYNYYDPLLGRRVSLHYDLAFFRV